MCFDFLPFRRLVLQYWLVLNFQRCIFKMILIALTISLHYYFSKNDRMAADMAVELKEQNVACVSLWPGAVMTENIRDYLRQPQDEKVICRFDTKTYVSTIFYTLQNAQVKKKNINIKKQIEGVKEFLLAQVNKYKIFIC